MAMDRAPGLAYDRMALDLANRWTDADGRLHVRLNNISKANVCPYLGAEIPNFEELGLDPNRVYKLLRHPEELAKAAATFNNLPLLSKHIPVSAEKPEKEFIVGSLGTDAAFAAPYLNNSLVIWDAAAIAGVDSKQKCELSSAYRYVADMEGGTHEGLTYDGVMRQIVGNHVALVETGRAGSDVVVGDAALMRGFQGVKVNMKLNSRTALMVQGALAAFVTPKLAQDAKVDFSKLLGGVNAKNFAKKKGAIFTRLTAATNGKLATDADIADVVDLLDAIGEKDVAAVEDDMITEPSADPAAAALDTDDATVSKIMEFLKGKISDDDMAALQALCEPTGDDPPEFKDEPKTGAQPPKVDKPAMDAAIKTAASAARTQAIKDMQAIRVAENEARPYIGELKIGMDSADDIYRLALESCGVELEGVPSAAFRSMLKLCQVPGTAPKRLATDGAPDAAFSTRFPGAARLKQG